MLADIWRKVRGQTLKDYVLFPLLSGPSFPFVLAGNATANLTRNLWAFTIIFCGHFPEGTHEFTEEEAESETRGEWYYRQMLGSANLTGGKLFHVLTGNLSYQIEHHLFPDLPAHRYGEISAEVREIRERYGIPDNTGPLPKQFGSVVRKIVKLALPPLPGVRASVPGVDEPAAEARPQKLTAAKTSSRKLTAAKTELAQAGRCGLSGCATRSTGSESLYPSRHSPARGVRDLAGEHPDSRPSRAFLWCPIRCGGSGCPATSARSPRDLTRLPTSRRWA